MPSSRPSCSTPLESTIKMFPRETPRRVKCSAVDKAEAPAPLKSTETSSIFLPTISSAFRSAAPAMIAVPCWSS